MNKTPYLTEQEIEKLYTNPAANEKQAGLYSAMIRIIYYTAARPREIVNLKVADIDFKLNAVTLGDTEKTPGKIRTIPIPPQIIDDLKELTKDRETSEYLFDGDKAIYQLTRVMKKRATESGITKKVFPYGLRHAGIIRYTDKYLRKTDLRKLGLR